MKLSGQTNEVYFIIFKGFQILMQFSLVGMTDYRFEHKNLPPLVLNEKKLIVSRFAKKFFCSRIAKYASARYDCEACGA